MTNPQPLPAQPASVQAWFDSREPIRRAFLSRHGWESAIATPVGEDCAFRRYFRFRRGNETAILMEAVPDGSAIATPGHSLSDFIRIGGFLFGAGLHTPEIFAEDGEQGYLLLEDFGDLSFKKAMEQGAQGRGDLYALATDVLCYMRDKVDTDPLALPGYYESHVHTGLRRVIDWYVPALKQARNPDGMVESYLEVWRDIEQSLPPCPQGFLHIDYHFENLMWLPQEKGIARCGILDFQGAMRGPLPYDLANLLEDARVTVPQDIRQAMLDAYTKDMGEQGRKAFLDWYRVVATQFHCRVAGQFIRLYLRDGKDRYLQHLPRLTGYLREGLEHPVLAPLKGWFAGQEIAFDKPPQVDRETAAFILPDAF